MSIILNPNNRLFALARQGRRQPSALVVIASALGAFVLIFQRLNAATQVLRSIFPDGTESITNPLVQGAAGILFNALVFVPVYLYVWGWLVLFSKRSFRTLGFERNRPLSRALRAALVSVLMVTAITVGLAMIPGATLAPGQLQTVGPIALGGGLLTLLAFLVQSSAEEVLFRGWLLAVIGARYRPWIGVLVSTLLFSLAHALNPHVTLLALLNLFLFGHFAAFYALSEGGLWGACAWHAAWNWAMGDVFGLPLDGRQSFGLLTSIHAAGPNVITGGPFGPDGGLLVSAVLLIGIGIVAVRTRREARHDRSREPSIASR